MRRHPRRPLCGSLVAGSLFLFLAAPATAHVFQSGTWEGALEGAVDLNRLEAKRKGFPLATSENLRSEERLTWCNVGVYICPGTEMADLVAYLQEVQRKP